VRIKVTGYMETGFMAPEDVDVEHDTGLSTDGYEHWMGRFPELDDLEFKLMED